MALVRADRKKAKSAGPTSGTAAFVRQADDAYGWALQQATLLRERRFDEIDAVTIADEIADLAHYLADKLQSDLTITIQHLLKWDFQPERRSRSWTLSIREHRRRVAAHLRKAPGLRSALPDILSDAFLDARDQALRDTDLPEATLPEACHYTWQEIMERPVVWPE